MKVIKRIDKAHIAMKTTNKNILLLLITATLAFSMTFTACKGPAGSEGPEGPAGPVGPAGADGSVMYAGEGAPSDDLGKSGDFYLNTSVAEMYGPKTDEGWGVPYSLQGPPGEKGSDGSDGSQIYSGTSAPDASMGQEGDYYLNKSTFDLYGPKTDSGWGTPVNLQATTNVMYSVWMEIVWNGSDGTTYKYMLIPESRITEDFLNAGGNVYMYLKQTLSASGADAIAVAPLPNLLGNEYLSFASLSGNFGPPTGDFSGIQLVHESVDLTTPLTIDYTDPQFQVRYVLIPGSEEISSKAASSSQPVDLTNYQQAKKYFSIRN